MNRFFYYLITVNMIVNIVASVPKILLDNSENGAINSMIAGLMVGVPVTYVIATFFNRYPGKGLPELLKDFAPMWFSNFILVYLAVNFYIGGLITLITYTYLLLRFLTPEMSIYIVVSSFILFVSYGVLMKTRSVLHTTEIVLILFTPIFFFMLLKAYTNSEMDWDTVRIAMMHINEFPRFAGFSASLFLFMGVSNLVVFNRLFTKKQKMSIGQLVGIGGMGAAILFTTYFIPIGFGGFDNINSLIYPWISTADSIRMKYGVVERIIFIFMLLYLGFALLSIIIHWHVSIQLLEGVFRAERWKWKGKSLLPFLAIVSFWIISVLLVVQLSEYQLFKYTKQFYNQLPLFIFFILLSFFVVNRGAKSK